LLTLGTLRRPHFACEQYIIWTHQREYYIGKSFYGGLHFKEGETSGFTATDDRAISIHGKTLGLQTTEKWKNTLYGVTVRAPLHRED